MEPDSENEKLQDLALKVTRDQVQKAKAICYTSPTTLEMIIKFK